MPVLSRLDPEFAPAVAQMPIRDLRDIPAARAAYFELMVRLPIPERNEAVEHSDHHAPGRDGHPDAMVRVFRPVGAVGPLPCFYWIQGGGFVLPSIDMDDAWCESIAAGHRCAVVAVKWRRAPEDPFPAAAEDCYAGLAWVVNNVEELGIDPAKIVVSGESSGGGSAAGLALLVRDRGEFTIAHQLLIYPMLDDTNTSPSSHAVTDAVVWNRECNALAWRAYLGETYGTSDVSAYAAPARMADLSGSAPTTMFTNELDLFVDEDITYAQRLIQAGVPTELHVYPGAPHGFHRIAPAAIVSQRFRDDRDAVLRRVFTAR